MNLIARLAIFGFLSLFLLSCGSKKEELHLFTWGEFIKPELIQRFEQENNCKVTLDTYDSNEAMYAKLKLGGSAAYDLVCPSNYFLSILQSQSMLGKFDPDKIPNLKNIDQQYYRFSSPSLMDSAIPFMVSYTGIGYRKDKVLDFIPSWSIFSRKNLKGRMTMLNDVREALGAALLFLNFSVNTLSHEEVDAAADLLIQWKQNLAKFESEQYKNGIASAEFLAVQGYSGDVLQIMQENDEVSFAYPQEGTIASIDYLAMLKNAPNPALAHKFINFLLEGKNAAENITYTFYLSPNQEAYKYLPSRLQENSILFPDRSILEKTEAIQNIGPATELYIKAWDRVKAAS